MSFSDKLVFLRTRYGLSKNELGERLGLSTKIINDWEKGKSLPEDRDYQKLSEIFGIKKDFFTNDTLSYKNIENFTRDEYWGIELTRSDCDGYINRSKKVAHHLSVGVYFILLIPIFSLIVDMFVKIMNNQYTNKEILTFKIVASIVLLIIGLVFIYLSNKQREKYKFVDNGMMYTLSKDDRIYVENIIDQEKPKSVQKIIFGVIFLILAVILSLNIDTIFGKIDDSFRILIILIIVLLINQGINWILNHSFRLSGFRKLLNNQNSYTFDDKNLNI